MNNDITPMKMSNPKTTTKTVALLLGGDTGIAITTGFWVDPGVDFGVGVGVGEVPLTS